MLLSTWLITQNVSKDAYEFYNLGLGELFTFPDISSSGTTIVVPNAMRCKNTWKKKLISYHVCQDIGRPNAVKSSFINAIGEALYQQMCR
jgi:GTP-binding protein